jgi:hypothetical protein
MALLEACALFPRVGDCPGLVRAASRGHHPPHSVTLPHWSCSHPRPWQWGGLMPLSSFLWAGQLWDNSPSLASPGIRTGMWLDIAGNTFTSALWCFLCSFPGSRQNIPLIMNSSTNPHLILCFQGTLWDKVMQRGAGVWGRKTRKDSVCTALLLSFLAWSSGALLGGKGMVGPCGAGSWNHGECWSQTQGLGLSF